MAKKFMINRTIEADSLVLIASLACRTLPVVRAICKTKLSPINLCLILCGENVHDKLSRSRQIRVRKIQIAMRSCDGAYLCP